MNSKLLKITISTIFILIAVAASLFAEKLSLKTGDIFGFSQTDDFLPLDRSFMMTSSTVSSTGTKLPLMFCNRFVYKSKLNLVECFDNLPLIQET